MYDPITRYGWLVALISGLALHVAANTLFESHKEILRHAVEIVIWGGLAFWLIYNRLKQGKFFPGSRSILGEWFAGGNVTTWLNAQAKESGEWVELNPNQKISVDDFSRSTVLICTAVCACFALVALIYAWKVYDIHTAIGSPYSDPHFREQERQASFVIAKAAIVCTAIFISLAYTSLLWKSLAPAWVEKQENLWRRSKLTNLVKIFPITWLCLTGISAISLIVLLSNWYEFYFQG